MEKLFYLKEYNIIFIILETFTIKFYDGIYRNVYKVLGGNKINYFLESSIRMNGIQEKFKTIDGIDCYINPITDLDYAFYLSCIGK